MKARGATAWLALALTMLLPSCASQPANSSFSALGKTSGQIVAEMSPLIYAKLGSLPMPANRSQAVALVFLQAGEPPHNPTCAANLKASLERQLRMLAERAHVDFRMTRDVEEASFVFVVGDTFEARKTQILRMKTWLSAARRRTPVSTSEFTRNFGVPGYDSSDFFEGVFTDAAGRLVFGVSLIHWMATRAGAGGKDCAINFLERLVEHYSQALESDVGRTFGEISRQARMRVGPSAYEVSGYDVGNFEQGVYFCAQFVDRTKLEECALQIVKLIPENDRHRE